MKAQKEAKLYECEVQRWRQAVAPGYEPFWKIKTVVDVMEDKDNNFRCKDCGGAVRLHGRNSAGGPAPHAEHLSRADSEYCTAGMYFQQSKDGREARLSSNPVTFVSSRESRKV